MTKPQPLDLDAVQEEVLEDYRIQKLYCVSKEAERGINAAIFLTTEVIEKRIMLACEFYLRYKDNPKLFADEQNGEIRVDYNGMNVLLFNKFFIPFDKYNDWLFKLAFKDVFEK